MNKTEEAGIKIIPIVVYLVVGAIVLHIAFTIASAFRFSKANVTYKISTGEFLENKNDFENLSHMATSLFEQEYEKDNNLLSIDIHYNQAYLFYSDKDCLIMNLNVTDEYTESHKELVELFHTGTPLAGFSHISVTKEQVLFVRGNGYGANVVLNKSIFKPKTISNEKTKIVAERLWGKWFQYGEKED